MIKPQISRIEKRFISCVVNKTADGWYVTFPHNPNAGLLLPNSASQIEFLTDCDIPAVDTDLDRIFRMFQVHQCPLRWYIQAKEKGFRL